MRKIFIVCGEYSGDFYASLLSAELKKAEPKTEIFAMGGEKLSNSGAELIENIEDTAEIGFSEIIKVLKKVKIKLKNILNFIKNNAVDAVILVDYPDFNLRLAKQIKRFNTKIKLFYFITPQVWAWRKGRIKTIKKYIDKGYPLYDFECKLYRENGINYGYFGHPLNQVIAPDRYDTTRNIIGFLPGSRDSAFFKMLKVYEKVIHWIKSNTPMQIAFSVVSPKQENIVKQRFGQDTLFLSSHDLMRKSRILIAASGTASLESAIIGTPHIFTYKISNLSYFIARSFIHLKYISPANFISGKSLVPELIQKNSNSSKIIGILADWLTDNKKLLDISNSFSILRSKICGSAPITEVAKDILQCLK